VADIFISYSSKDREKAKKLAEQLQGLGYSTWMDVSDLEPSSRWSTEIVEAIEMCRILALLLSRASLASENVVKELSLAAEKKKHILPIVLEKTKLNPDFEYHLAGLQHTSIDNLNAIVRALEHLASHGAHPPAEKPLTQTPYDTRARIAVLPLDDYSPARDNDWFSEGLTNELITKLSKVSQLFVVDRLTSREYKDTHVGAKQIASELHVRYLVSGAVRKAGERIHIDVTLIDALEGKTLWDDSYPGIMDDIFAIQEEVAAKIAKSLQVVLTKDEERTIRERPTENLEAYELFLRGSDHFSRYTRADYDRGRLLYSEAVAVDPSFATAFASLAFLEMEYYRSYSRERHHLDSARKYIEHVRELEGESAEWHALMSRYSLHDNHLNDAIEHGRKSVALDPEYTLGYETLGFALREAGDLKAQAEVWKESVRHSPGSRNLHFNYLIALSALGDANDLRQAAIAARSPFERHMRLTPDDHSARVLLAHIYRYSGDYTRSLEQAEVLSRTSGLDGIALYNLACLFLVLGDIPRGFMYIAKSLENGYSEIETIRYDPDLDPLRGKPEFEALLKELEERLQSN
jgi:TolB-like protein